MYINGVHCCDLWEQQNVQNPKLFIYNYVQRIKDQYIQRWRIECANNSKLKTCYIFIRTLMTLNNMFMI